MSFNPDEKRDNSGKWTAGALREAIKALKVGQSMIVHHAGGTQATIKSIAVKKGANSERHFHVTGHDGFKQRHKTAAKAAAHALSTKTPEPVPDMLTYLNKTIGDIRESKGLEKLHKQKQTARRAKA